MIAPTTRKDLMIVNMGPHHPSMYGVICRIVTFDGVPKFTQKKGSELDKKKSHLDKKRSDLDKKKRSGLDKSFLSITSDQSIEY